MMIKKKKRFLRVACVLCVSCYGVGRGAFTLYKSLNFWKEYTPKTSNFFAELC